MKFTVHFKTPDALDHAICALSVITTEERDRALDLAKQYIKYDEFVSIEFDTDTETAVVLRK